MIPSFQSVAIQAPVGLLLSQRPEEPATLPPVRMTSMQFSILDSVQPTGGCRSSLVEKMMESLFLSPSLSHPLLVSLGNLACQINNLKKKEMRQFLVQTEKGK